MWVISSFTKTVYINMTVWMNYKMSLKIAYHLKLIRNEEDIRVPRIRKIDKLLILHLPYKKGEGYPRHGWTLKPKYFFTYNISQITIITRAFISLLLYYSLVNCSPLIEVGASCFSHRSQITLTYKMVLCNVHKR